MLELKSKNLFIKSGDGSHRVISKVLDFYDLIGKNILLLHCSGSMMSSWVKFSKQEFKTSTLKSILPEHLFRLDLIVVDGNQNIEENYRIIRQITELPVIFLVDIRCCQYQWVRSAASSSFVVVENFDTSYILSKSIDIHSQMSPTVVPKGLWSVDKLEDYLVESLREEWKSNLKELKIQYIRDKNLRDILGDDE